MFSIEEGELPLKIFMSITLGVIALLTGKKINESFRFLKDFSIPEPVTGGIVFAIIITLIYLIFKIEISFDLASRDVLLIYFFTTIGINANLKDLARGGKPFIILALVTFAYIIIQNFTGIGVGRLFGLPAVEGLLGGSISLIGGHGTAIAWAPEIAKTYGVSNAMEIGLTCATFGLILSSIIGGPISKYLITKHKLSPDKTEVLDVGLPSDEKKEKQIGHFEVLNAILAIHICIILGVLINLFFVRIQFKLPLFVSCLLAGLFISNIIPTSFPGFKGHIWPSRKPAIAMIADLSLGTFLAMSLMSMKLWTLADLALPIFSILAIQLVVIVVIILFILFPLMGKNYDAVVISAGFAGFGLGATPTAMANMTAVSQRYGASNMAFVIVPLLCAFFIDISNAFIIPFFLRFC